MSRGGWRLHRGQVTAEAAEGRHLWAAAELSRTVLQQVWEPLGTEPGAVVTTCGLFLGARWCFEGSGCGASVQAGWEVSSVSL